MKQTLLCLICKVKFGDIFPMLHRRGGWGIGTYYADRAAAFDQAVKALIDAGIDDTLLTEDERSSGMTTDHLVRQHIG